MILGIALLGAGVFWYRTGAGEPDKIEIITNEAKSEKIRVDMAGEVVNPGVYDLDYNSRAIDALEAAGGLASGADLDWVEANLNRAAILRDGQKIYIPTKNNQETITKKQTINLNSANSGELESLPGVGPVLAGKIISGRPYQEVDELLSRKIVGQKVWEQIKELVSVW